MSGDHVDEHHAVESAERVVADDDATWRFGERACDVVGDVEVPEYAAAEVGIATAVVDFEHAVELLLAYSALHPSYNRRWNVAVVSRKPLA